jgi:hypothetical protein
MVIKLCIRRTKKRADGRYTLYFSFAERGKTRYIASDVAVAAAKNIKNGQITGDPNANYSSAKLNQQLIGYQKKYDGLPLHVKYAALNTILEALKSPKPATLLFRERAQKIIDAYRAQGKGSRRIKEQALAKFVAKHGNLTLESIAKATITELMADMQATLSDTSTGMYLREIKSMYNKAVNDERITRIHSRASKFQRAKSVKLPLRWKIFRPYKSFQRSVRQNRWPKIYLW